MNNFQLQVYLHILGIGSASGLLYHDNSLFIISDNSSFLYEYHLENNSLEKHPLNEKPQENILKKDKPDFESITKKGNKIIILGSGSTENRNKIISYHLLQKKIINSDFKIPFETLKKSASLSDDELNIEGFVVLFDKTLFFQRGNSSKAQNGIFIYNENDYSTVFKPIILPKINNIEATFTDAVLVNDKIYILASVENTNSTYEDGEILGTFLGKLNAVDFSLENTVLLSTKNKFEGITLLQQTETEIEFLLCEDNDTSIQESTIYKLKINN